MRRTILVYAGIFFALLWLCAVSSAELYDVKTGYGYMEDKQGRAISKVRLSIGGRHNIVGNLKYVELDNEEAYNKLELYEKPLPQTNINEKKIIERMRKLSIDSLKAEGELPLDYKDVR